MCWIQESVNPNQLLRSSLRCVSRKKMCFIFFSQFYKEGQQFVTRPPCHKEATVRFTIGLFWDLVLFWCSIKGHHMMLFQIQRLSKSSKSLWMGFQSSLDDQKLVFDRNWTGLLVTVSFTIFSISQLWRSGWVDYCRYCTCLIVVMNFVSIWSNPDPPDLARHRIKVPAEIQ